MAELTTPSSVHGKSFAKLLNQPDSSFRDYIYSRYGAADTVMTKRYSYTRYSGKYEGIMLYDHRNDPKENVNIAVNPENQPVIEKMEKLLNQSKARAAVYKKEGTK